MIQPPPVSLAPHDPFTTWALAYKRWQLRGGKAGPPEAAIADWIAAARVRHQVIAEAAYLRWKGRGCAPGDSRKDWFDAEAAIIKELREQGHIIGRQAARRLRNQLIAEAAYLRWKGRGCARGDPLRDWTAAEAEIPDS